MPPCSGDVDGGDGGCHRQVQPVTMTRRSSQQWKRAGGLACGTCREFIHSSRHTSISPAAEAFARFSSSYRRRTCDPGRRSRAGRTVAAHVEVIFCEVSAKLARSSCTEARLV